MMERPPQIKPHHLEKLALIYRRQSTPEQVRDNVGSTDVQRGLSDRARGWGWPESRILIIDDFGVSGSHTGLRHGFQQVLDLIDRGEVAIVLVSDASRLSRNRVDARDFLVRVMAHGVFLEIGRKLYAPGDADLPALFGLHDQNGDPTHGGSPPTSGHVGTEHGTSGETPSGQEASDPAQDGWKIDQRPDNPTEE